MTEGGSALGRRAFLTLAGAGAVGAIVAGCSSSTRTTGAVPAAASTTTIRRLPAPATAPFDTVVVVMMENRSFDHWLGWMPGADGRQTGMHFVDARGVTQPTHALAPDFQGCAFHDPRHDWKSVARQYNGGACDGWLATQRAGDTFPIGYYTAADLPVTAALARGHTVCDRYFCSVMGPTGPNRMYAWSATTDYVDFDGALDGRGKRPSNVQLAIFDRLREAGVSAAYFTGAEAQSYAYASRRYDAITYPTDQFFARAGAGTLPHVTYLDPDLDSITETTGTAFDDHPYGDVRRGEEWLARVYDALAASPQWSRTVLVVTFDEHGGFFDHVPPPRVADDTKLAATGPDLTRLGFRVPCIVAGPYATARVVHDGPFEHCSILKLIEWRWDLEPMTARDRHANNLADVLDFSHARPPVTLPAFHAPAPATCTAAQTRDHLTS